MSEESRVTVISFGNNVTLTAYPSECCEFVYWVEKENICNIVSKDNPWTFSVDDDKEYVAVFEKKKVRIDVVLNKPYLGYTEGSGVYECGSDVFISASTFCCNDIRWSDESIENTNLSECKNCKDEHRTITATLKADSDRTIVANVGVNEYNISAYPCDSECGTCGIVTISNGYNYSSVLQGCDDNSINLPITDGIFVCGSEILLYAYPKPGCVFDGWYLSNTEFCNDCNTTKTLVTNEPFYVTSVCGDACYFAFFKKEVKYNVSFSSEGCESPDDTITFEYSIGDREHFQEYISDFKVDDRTLVYFRVQEEGLKCCNPTNIIINDRSQYYSPNIAALITNNTNVVFVFENVCSPDYFNFISKAKENEIYFYNYSGVINFELSYDGEVWSNWDFNEPIRLNEDEIVYIRGDNENGLSGNYFGIMRETECHGNIMTLLDKDGLLDTVPVNGFGALFYGCEYLLTAPELPALYLSLGCYQEMFSGCTFLREAPTLPATTLSEGCYSGMFYSCASLREAPTLPATTLSEGCYSGMFYGCTSLTEAPALPATSLANRCYEYMFGDCSSLIEAPALPATTLSEGCYSSMFYSCASLREAPTLPATTLSEGCYSGMFYGCTSLTEAPALPATTLSEGCYSGMFNNCTSLSTAPLLLGSILANSCYDTMFSGCTSLTIPPQLNVLSLKESCYRFMFSSCTSLTEAPALPATTLADSCYYGMFQSCSNLIDGPILPAETMYTGCYSNMFRNCTNITGIYVNITSWNSDNSFMWLYNVSQHGTIHKPAGTTIPSGPSGIPTGWVTENI